MLVNPILHPGGIVRGAWASEPAQETYLRRVWGYIKGRQGLPDLDISRPPPNSKIIPSMADLEEFSNQFPPEGTCDAIDGIEDGVIDDPRACTSKYFDPSSLMCSTDKATDCLSEGQIRTAKFLYGGLVDPNTGAVLAHGVMPLQSPHRVLPGASGADRLYF